MFDVSSWVRAMFRDAAPAGVQDAMLALTPEGEQPPTDLAELRQRLAAAALPKTLPAAPPATDPGEPAEPAGGRKKKG